MIRAGSVVSPVKRRGKSHYFPVGSGKSMCGLPLPTQRWMGHEFDIGTDNMCNKCTTSLKSAIERMNDGQC